jgi:hypothetical protein
MHVFELIYPGTWLEHPSGKEAWAIKRMLHLLEHQLTDAAIALNLFEEALQAQVARDERDEELYLEDFEERRRRLSEWTAGRTAEVLTDQREHLYDYSELREKTHEIDVALKREKWRAGRWPEQYEERLMFVHARTFVSSLDGMRKVLAVLAGSSYVPGAARSHASSFDARFPDLRGVRDSLQHPEARSRGLDRNKQPIPLSPVDTPALKTSGGRAGGRDARRTPVWRHDGRRDPRGGRGKRRKPRPGARTVAEVNRRARLEGTQNSLPQVITGGFSKLRGGDPAPRLLPHPPNTLLHHGRVTGSSIGTSVVSRSGSEPV